MKDRILEKLRSKRYTSTQQLALPNEEFRLEEVNMPEELAASLAGQTVAVEVYSEETPMADRLGVHNPPDGLPIVNDGDGVARNDYRTALILYTDPGGRAWRLPRQWASVGVSPVIEVSRYGGTHQASWLEKWFPATWWDMCDINIPDEAAFEGDGLADIEVHVAPGEVARVYWKDPSGKTWRIPHDWRRRRIKLPGFDGLLRNGFTRYLAKKFGGRIVSVNYHPGSLCCLPDGYRVRDGRGGKWPVRAADCVVVGFGDEAERHA